MVADAAIEISSIAEEGETIGTSSTGSVSGPQGGSAAPAAKFDGKDLLDTQVLRGQHAIETLERERPFAIEEI